MLSFKIMFFSILLLKSKTLYLIAILDQYKNKIIIYITRNKTQDMKPILWLISFCLSTELAGEFDGCSLDSENRKA